MGPISVMEQILIEPLKAKDLIFLNKVRNSCAAEYLHDPRIFTMEETIEWFKNLPPEHRYYLISIHDEYFGNLLIGYFRTREYSFFYTEPHKTSNKIKAMEIGCDIAEHSRGNGYGRQAYTQFIDKLKQDGIEYLSLEVLASNTRAIHLYFSLGFEPAGWRLFLRKGESAYTPSLKMHRILK